MILYALSYAFCAVFLNHRFYNSLHYLSIHFFDPLLESLPLYQITGASIQHMIAFGQNAPGSARRVLQDPQELQAMEKTKIKIAGR
jgi:hypothetical protein